MYTEIKSEISRFEKQHFSGHIRFGIEKGKVVSEVVSSEVGICRNSGEKGFDEFLGGISDDNFYGTVEYDFDFGKIIRFSWQRTFNGEDLKKHLESAKCRTVRIVLKK